MDKAENSPSKPRPIDAGWSESKHALLLAGEAVFARDGIDNASLREIASLAGQKNHNAVQYHFGSRENLMRAVFEFRMEQMEEYRARMLADARNKETQNDTRTLVEIVFLPQLELIDARGDHSYAAFLSEYLMRFRGAGFGDFGASLPQQLQDTLALLRQALGSISETTAQRRLITACFMFLNILVSFTRQAIDKTGESLDEAIEDTITQIVAALEVTPKNGGVPDGQSSPGRNIQAEKKIPNA